MRLGKEKSRVIIDVDGVLRDFIASLFKVYLREYPDHNVTQIASRELHECFPIGEKVYKFMDETFAWEILTGAPPFPGAIEALQKWHQKFNIVIATNQPPLGKAPTLVWLGTHHVPSDEIHITADKHLLPGVAILDDFVDNLDEFASTGRLAVCMDRPWNKDWKGPRVETVDDFFCLILEYLKETDFDEGVLLA